MRTDTEADKLGDPPLTRKWQCKGIEGGMGCVGVDKDDQQLWLH